MKFILIRHAQSAPNSSSHQSEWGLTIQGEQSCQQLAEFLHTENVSHIYSSHEKKAIQTAEYTAHHLSCSHSVFSGLEEQNNDGVGWFESADDFRAAVQKLFEQPNQAVFGPEAASQAAGRFSTALTAISQKHEPDATLGIVTHGRVMSSFLQSFGVVDAIPFWRSLTFPDAIVIRWPGVEVVGRQSF